MPSDSVDKPVTSKTLSQSTTQTPKPVTAPTDKKQIVVQIQDNNTIKDICTRSQVISIITDFTDWLCGISAMAAKTSVAYYFFFVRIL